MKIILICILGVVAIVLSLIWSGYVLAILWGWFIVPVLSCAQLSIPQAIGLSATVRYLTWQHSTAKPDDRPWQEQAVYAISAATIYPAFALLIGWAVSFWL